jgi:ectoine hydroxylase
MPQLQLSASQVDDYRAAGFLLVRGFLDAEETGLLQATAKADKALDDHANIMDDGAEHPVRLALWNHPGDTVYGMIARSNALVNAMERVLGGEVYHYHSKMILKDAKVGGAWTWHQDYGYWYHNGVLAPLLASASIALDPATRENGCLQVVRGSHALGRIDHVLAGEQAGADPERMAEILHRFPVEFIEMKPGDALLFDCNLLHCSGPNLSEQARWSMICCYNAARNDPYKESHHPRYTPLVKVEDAAVLQEGRRREADLQATQFWAKTDGAFAKARRAVE